MLSQFVLLLKVKINQAFPLLVYKRFLFSLSSICEHFRYHLRNVPPQPNSPSDYVFRLDQSKTLELESPYGVNYVTE